MRSFPWSAVVLVSAPTLGWGAPPELRSTVPAGLQRGVETQLTLYGAGLGAGMELVLPFPAEIKSSSASSEIATFSVKPAGDVPVGVYPIRVRTTGGVSNMLLLAVHDLPRVVEVEPNDRPLEAQRIAWPCMITGALGGRGAPHPSKDVDRYKFTVKAGQRLTFVSETRRVGLAADLALRLRDAKGRELAFCDDVPGLGVEPRLDHTFKEAGDYTVEVHFSHFNYSGRNHNYLLKVGPFDYARSVFPLGGKRGETVSLTVADRDGKPSTMQARVPSDPNAAAWSLPLDKFPGSLPGDGFRLLVGQAENVRQRRRRVGELTAARGDEGTHELVVRHVVQVFLGTRLECAQCHDHPFDRWTQSDYNSLATFFYQVARKDGQDYYAEGQVYLQPEKNKQVHLRFLDGSDMTWPPADRLSADKGDGVRDRRIALADWMLGPARQWTARALVNRVWGKLFGRGIIEPVDDFRFSNPPVNEPLLDALAEEFIANGYDFKRLVSTILQSRTYQASSKPNATNASDQTYFSRAALRRLTAEQLLDSLSQATGIEEEFRSLPAGLRAAQVPTVHIGSYFLKTFGRPPRKSVCACERTQTPTLPQTLLLMNGATMMKRLRAEGGTLDRLLKARLDDDALIEEFYLHALSRPPQPAERTRARAYLTAADERAQAAEDLFWALLNSRQFLFNH